MKKTIIQAAAFAIFFAAFVLAEPARAQENSPANPDVPGKPVSAQDLLNSPLYKTYTAVIKDMAPLFKVTMPLQQRVDAAGKFSFSPETKALLKDSFGNDDPLHFTVDRQPGGETVLSTVLDSLDYKSQSGTVIHSEKANGESVIDADFKHLKFDFVLPSVTFDTTTEPKHVQVGKFEMSGDYAVGPGNMLFGKANARLDNVTVSSSDGSPALVMRDLTVDGNTTLHNKLLFLDYDYRIAAVDWGSDKITDIRTDIGLDNIDAQALQALSAQFEGLEQIGDDRARLQAGTELLKKLAVIASRHNAALELRNVSAQYHGYTAGFSGKISAPNLREADFSAGDKAYQKIQLRLRFHIPMSMVDEIAHRVARAMMEAQAKQNGMEVTDMAVDLVARGVIGKMSDALVKQQKWAHMEKNELVTVFELKKGKMYLDGHMV
ncbi:MAG: DUF945 family protein, partial [Burkholderiaceae bacterium]|nr:DUF945 family protein [Burkholderiaceae bacterium]